MPPSSDDESRPDEVRGSCLAPTPPEDALYADDLRAGMAFRLGSYTVTKDELIEFARQWDPQDFHIDEQAAADGFYGGLIASGIHTLAIYQRLAVCGVFHRMSVIAGRTLREVRFVRPVRAGDSLTGVMRIEQVAEAARGRALVTTRTELTNQQAQPALTVLMDAYLRTRRA